MNAPLHPNELPPSSTESVEHSVCPTCGRLVVAPKSDMPYSPEKTAAVISANPDDVSSSVYAAWDGD
ncbi:hypothetical protein OGR47_13435 [Methylocystis sp. MJC1]|uniref:hypothetical protein n=1 Tax=Methylocystis sp. MJC1 TaxID=2654282 RepID=UPI0013EB7C44|nr:hypothetical protein [Methylocystis sp. MJC1]KAF2989436.1 hypothetical protein MJC1_03410 [Methylocystis sp. MJC1]MBU6527973.1 hypothetical protein [Methylocystis sp. MJC1]UZX10894.1 hypothetical protein OGR47_13435 [Methylocystis sp. MJC1]